jgi:hypothetical protein
MNANTKTNLILDITIFISFPGCGKSLIDRKYHSRMAVTFFCSGHHHPPALPLEVARKSDNWILQEILSPVPPELCGGRTLLRSNDRRHAQRIDDLERHHVPARHSVGRQPQLEDHPQPRVRCIHYLARHSLCSSLEMGRHQHRTLHCEPYS